MLGKLMKYEFKALARILLPIYLALIAASGLFSFVLSRSSINEAPGVVEFHGPSWIGNNSSLIVSGTIYGFAAFLLFAVTLIMVIQRFNKNLYGDEGYLTLALPVKLSTHVTNKVISAAIWAVLSGIVGCVSIVIIVGGIIGYASMLSKLASLWNKGVQYFGVGGTVLLLVEAVLAIMVSAASFAAKIYAAISVGHVWSVKHTVLMSVIAFLLFDIVESALLSFISINRQWGINVLMNLSWIAGNLTVHVAMLIAIILELLVVLIFWLIAWLTMKNRTSLN